ncbi:MAG TPA: hypothetical protein GXX48_02305 [Ochrobactrum intermedium]|uniref:Uncharacterized protein n=1 Tax=Brucella intermedia TaxID=94625 RepID=A0A7V6TYB2_9HYPH|nr:hypothetical protein [Brucella intermedia]HHV66472.1 hypothetical protein [Brucella intermedia]
MKYIKIDEIRTISERYGLSVKTVSVFDGGLQASITFSNGEDDFKFDKGRAGGWFSEEFSKDSRWGYTLAGSTGGLHVNLDYWQLLKSEDSCGHFATIEEMLGAISSRYELDGAAIDVDLDRVLALGVFVEDIEIEDIEGELAATFVVRSFDADSNESVFRGHEWIDLNDGLLSNKDSSDLYRQIGGEPIDLSDSALFAVYALLNDHLSTDPIEYDFLESYREAAVAELEDEDELEDDKENAPII